jgi:ribosomal protein L11 methyltransferase
VGFHLNIANTGLWFGHVTVTALFAIGADESAIKESLQQICNIDKVTFVLLKDRVWEDVL